jgi:hypothetical protein
MRRSARWMIAPNADYIHYNFDSNPLLKEIGG